MRKEDVATMGAVTVFTNKIMSPIGKKFVDMSKEPKVFFKFQFLLIF